MNVPIPNSATPIWAIHAGINNRYWVQWKQQGYIAIGWPDIGSVAELTSADEFMAALKNHDLDGKKQSNNAHALNNFINVMQVGDIVVVANGRRIIEGIGIITGSYQFIADGGEQSRRRSVQWIKTETEEIFNSRNFPTKTLTLLQPNTDNYATVLNYMGDLLNSKDLEEDFAKPMTEDELFLRHNLNLIFYGVPGTGKTYRTRLLLESVVGELMVNSAEQGSIQYWWVCANQKFWHWGDLFGGGNVPFKFGRVARNYRDIQEGDIVFGYLTHPQKKIYVIAKVVTPPGFDAKGHPIQEQEMVLAAHRELTAPLVWENINSDPILKNSEPVRHRAQGTLFHITNDEARHLLTLLKKAGNDVDDLFVFPEKQYEFITFHQSFSYEQFVEGLTAETDEDGKLIYRIKDGIFKKLAKRAEADPGRPYILVIDEINRGNISKIFGELLTLLEKDKRIGEPQEIRTTLPYSGEFFGVPSNLYIVGTMNTTDRSIALLDVALRRRFTFVELMPIYNEEIWKKAGSPIEIEGINLPLLLKKLNEKITAYYSRDHNIGHSYFFGIQNIDELRYVWFYQIIPLLQEYFYNDAELFEKVLGKSFVYSNNIGEYRQALPVSIDDMDNNSLLTALKGILGKPISQSTDN